MRWTGAASRFELEFVCWGELALMGGLVGRKRSPRRPLLASEKANKQDQVPRQTHQNVGLHSGSLAFEAGVHMHLDAIDTPHAKMEGVFWDDTRCGDPDGLAKIDQR